MSQLPLAVEQVVHADLVHEVEGVGDGEGHRVHFLLVFALDLLGLPPELERLALDGLLSGLAGEGAVLEGVFDVEHGGMVHVDEGVKYFFLVLVQSTPELFAVSG